MYKSRRQVVRFLPLAAAAAAALPTAARAADTIHVGIINSSTDAPFFIADAKGYFKDEGLKVDFVPFDAGAFWL
jgi:NitT/TauT family transport system substrate-binding protein